MIKRDIHIWLRWMRLIVGLTILSGFLVALPSRDTTQEWMALLYPVMTAASLLVTVVLFLYYIRARPVRLVMANTCYFGVETVVLLLLTLTTGNHPLLSIEEYRPLVAYSRLVMWIVQLWIIDEGTQMIFGEKE